MYRALDIREVSLFKEGNVNTESYSSRHRLDVLETQYTIVIAEDEASHKRIRFEFYPGYSVEFLDKTHYFGYRGDFDILIPGDRFTVEETSTWDQVTLIKEDTADGN